MTKATVLPLLVLLASLGLQACSSAPKRNTSSRPSPPILSEGPSPSSSAPGTTSNPGRAPTPAQAPAPSKRAGGYYLDDGPGANPPDIDSIADAIPKREPLAARANRPYSIFGIQYNPLTELKPYRERGFASWYGKKFHGQTTSNGERYDMYAMSAAHPTFPLPSYARVTNPKTGKSVVVRVNDRGPFLHNRIIDLSYTAAAKLGYANTGSAEVEVSLIDEPEKFAMLAKGSSSVPEPLAASVPAVAPAPAPVVAPAQTITSARAAVPAPVAAASFPAPATEPVSASTQVPEPGLVLTRETVIAQQATAPVPGLYLQLGAFAAKETAEATKQRLTQQFPWLSADASAKIDYLMRTEAGLIKLHIGPYKSRADALANIDRLRTESGLQAFVVAR
jgi:rare lipoprotein A